MKRVQLAKSLAFVFLACAGVAAAQVTINTVVNAGSRIQSGSESYGIAQGSLFANCRSQAPWTLPSHMSLMTSVLPSHNGVDNLNKVLPAGIPTLAHALRTARP